MAYNRGVRILENPTALTAPIIGTAGLQVIVGTSPVNLAEDPQRAVNTPMVANSFAEASAAVGYSDDMSFTLNQSIYASFKLFPVAPVILINVLDPKKHKKACEEASCPVKDGQALMEQTGVLLSTLNVKNGAEDLMQGEDYLATFDNDGYVVLTLLADGKGAGAETLTVTGDKIDPTKVTERDIIGGYNVSTGEESGLELIRQVYPRFGMTPGLIVAPGFSRHPSVSAVMAAKCEDINDMFRCECVVDVDCTADGAQRYTDVKAVKEKSGLVSPHMAAVWPKVKAGGMALYYSAVFAAITAYTDAGNDDIPNLSPSNKMMAVTATCLDDEDDTEVAIDKAQANMVASYGVITATNINGFRTWGSNTAVYPSSTDPKDRWFNCRRFFSWWGNSFILSYFQYVDRPLSKRLVKSICDAENIRGNAYVAQGKCAGARIVYQPDDNPVTDIINGKITFRQYLAPFPPAEDIVNILEFDPAMLQSALE